VFANVVMDSLSKDAKGKWMTYVIMGSFLGSVLRYLCHVVSGIVFFGEYAPKGQPVAIYSLLYNGTYMLPSFVISAIIIIIVISAVPKRLFSQKNQ
jgi:thiamine transporter